MGEKGIDRKTYVIGSGTARPLREYTEIVREMTASDIAIQYGAVAYGKNQVMNLCADISEIQKDTGWKPKTSFTEGIGYTLKAYDGNA